MIPDVDYLVYDLSHLEDEEIKGEAKLRIYTLLVRAIFNSKYKDKQAEILKEMKHFSKIEDGVSALRYLHAIMQYIFSALSDYTLEEAMGAQKAIQHTLPEGE